MTRVKVFELIAVFALYNGLVMWGAVAGLLQRIKRLERKTGHEQ